MEPKIIKETNDYTKRETDLQIWGTNQWLAGEKGRGEEQDRGRGLRGTNRYVLHK